MAREKSEEFRKAASRWKKERRGEKGAEDHQRVWERFGVGRKHIFRCMLFPAGGRKLSSLQEQGREVNKARVGCAHLKGDSHDSALC